MTGHLQRDGQRIQILLRAEEDGVIGDARIEIHPGQTAFGKTYDEWLKVPEGPIEPSWSGLPPSRRA